MYIIKNNFHNTEAKTKGGRLSTNTERRIRRKLCGIQGCTCGGIIGERGPQGCAIEYDSQNHIYICEK